MIGAIIGDIVGSVYEFDNHRKKEFEFFAEDCMFTDDSVMSLAVAKALMETEKKFPQRGEDFYEALRENAIVWMQEIGRMYPFCGYGGRFYEWMFTEDPQPYNSYGNGSAMRISAVGYMAQSLEDAKKMSQMVTEISHNHPEGLKGAEATAVLIYEARNGKSKEELREIAEEYYDLDFTLEEIRPTYRFNETCQNTVPQAIVAFLEAEDFEDGIRNAISVGGDSDTLAAIAGGILEAYYGVPEDLEEGALSYLDERLKDLYKEWKDYLSKQV
ncbi:MAG: ADP-ribosylglycohydrolase family protein [Tissierellia bacterium]|nr:ADP-ribosylglycohydrolase family protein [Tissierellia bacterium]